MELFFTLRHISLSHTAHCTVEIRNDWWVDEYFTRQFIFFFLVNINISSTYTIEPRQAVIRTIKIYLQSTQLIRDQVYLMKEWKRHPASVSHVLRTLEKMICLYSVHVADAKEEMTARRETRQANGVLATRSVVPQTFNVNKLTYRLNYICYSRMGAA